MSSYLRVDSEQVVVVKNTFLERVDDNHKALQRSASDSDLCSHSSSSGKSNGSRAGKRLEPPITHAVWGTIDPPTSSGSESLADSIGIKKHSEQRAAKQDVQESATSKAIKKSEPPITHAVWGAVDPPTSSGSNDGSSGQGAMTQYVETAMQNVEVFSDSASSGKASGKASDWASGKGSAGPEHVPITRAEKMAELHKVGKCTPCHYMTTALSCWKGDSCRFCHQPHPKKPARPSRGKRAQCQKLVAALEDLKTSQPDVFQDQVQELLKEDSYLSTLMKKKLQEKADDLSQSLLTGDDTKIHHSGVGTDRPPNRQGASSSMGKRPSSTKVAL